MAKEPENIVLVYLRRIDEKLDRALEDARHPNLRLMPTGKPVARTQGKIGALDHRIDRVEARLERIERRLDLVELPK